MSRYATPLRYPGGKQRLAPFVAEVMGASGLTGGHYVEPYAGGAGVAMELLLSGVASHVHLNDLSTPIYAFWRIILTKTDELCRRISRASLTVDEWRRQKQILSRPRDASQLDLAFSFFFLNRCNRSGIPSAGVIGGIEQSGKWKIDARFPRNELIHRIEAIAAKRSSISVKNWNAERYLQEYVSTLPSNTLVYCDPPYFRKAERLYLNHYEHDDHARIAAIIQKDVAHPWLVSYDNAPEVVQHFSRRRSFAYDLQYNVARVYKGTEVFFFSDKLTIPSSSAVESINASLEEFPKRNFAPVCIRTSSRSTTKQAPKGKSSRAPKSRGRASS